MLVCKKRLWRCIAASLLITSLLLSAPLAQTQGEEALPAAAASSAVSYREQDGSLIAENDYLSMEVDTSTGEFVLTDRASGRSYRSTPEGKKDMEVQGSNRFIMYSLLTVTVLDKETHEPSVKVSYTGSVMREGLTVERIQDGVRLSYSFPENELTVPLDLLLKGDVFSARVDMQAISQTGAYLVESVGILPCFGCGTAEDDGYLFIPDGSGALVDFGVDKSGFRAYSQPVYGSDPAYAGDMATSQKTPIRLPVFGIQRNGSAFLAEITSGAEAASIEARAPGMVNKQGTVWASFTRIGSGLVTIGESSQGAVKESKIYQTDNSLVDVAQVDYHLLPEGGGYTAMAALYKNLLRERGVGAQTIDKTALYCEFVGGVMRQESFLGFYVHREKTLTTIADIRTAMEELQIPETKVVYTEWTSQQIQGKLQTKAAASSKLGGSKQLKALAEELGGGRLLLSYEPLIVEKGSWGFWKYLDAARRIGGELNKLYSYKPSTLYIDKEKPLAYLLRTERWDKTFTPFLRSFTEQYTGAELYSATLANTLFTDFDKKHFTTRTQVAQAVTDRLAASQQSWTLREPNAYALPYTQTVTEVPVTSSGFDLFTRDVPFYTLALDGLINKTIPAVNQNGDSRFMLLKALETGSNLYFRFTCQDPETLTYTVQDCLYYSAFSGWKEEVKSLYAEYAAVTKQVDDAEITGHRWVTEKVYETIYDNGVRIFVNYGDSPVTAESIEIPAMGYVVA